jgi:hypothetical protein
MKTKTAAEVLAHKIKLEALAPAFLIDGTLRGQSFIAGVFRGNIEALGWVLGMYSSSENPGKKISR